MVARPRSAGDERRPVDPTSTGRCHLARRREDVART
jgi:hypothetical protein